VKKKIDDKFDDVVRKALGRVAEIKCSAYEHRLQLQSWVGEIRVTVLGITRESTGGSD
jgi:hypothetical protein